MFLHKNPFCQSLGRIARQNGHPRLTKNRAGIKFRRYLMHRAARLRIPGIERPLMRMQARIFRQKRRVNVQHPAFETAHEIGGQNAHEARKTQDIRLGGKDGLQQLGLECSAVAAKGTMIDGCGRHAQRRSLGQSLGSRIVGGDEHRDGKPFGLHRFDQPQHVGATPGNQDGDPCHSRRPL